MTGPYYTDDIVTLWHGDCLDVLATLPDESVHAVVTDPPYGLANTDPGHVAETIVRWVNGERDYLPGGAGFMGKAWDAFVPPPAVWDECLRVLKPGGHLLAFAGSRTIDLMTLGVRLAGFEIRDSISWLYGSGFPKSLDVSKAIDKAAGAERAEGAPGPYASRRPRTTVESAGTYRDGVGEASSAIITAPATPDAARWSGWGTALKPAHEPIVVARKPIRGTVAANVLTHGTGAINVDGCRVESDESTRRRNTAEMGYHGGNLAARYETGSDAGRWPTNVVLDESAAAELDRQSGVLQSGANPTRRGTDKFRDAYGDFKGQEECEPARGADSGGASRFFPTFRYEAKAPTAERPTFYTHSCDCEDPWPTPMPSPPRATGATTEPGDSSTSRSGSDTTGSPSPTGTRSTTLTGTSSTTPQGTSSRSPQRTTSGSTPGASSATVDGGSRAASAPSSSPSTQSTGTSAARGGRSTGAAAPATSREWSAISVCGGCGAPARREAHATVKPLDLMRWLVRLVTPPGGTVLEPFAGSGTTAEACVIEGFACIAIEREADYLPLIVQRLSKPIEPVLDLGEWTA